MHIPVQIEENGHKTQLYRKKRRVKLETISTSKSPAVYEEAHQKVHQKFNKKGGRDRTQDFI